MRRPQHRGLSCAAGDIAPTTFEQRAPGRFHTIPHTGEFGLRHLAEKKVRGDQRSREQWAGWRLDPARIVLCSNRLGPFDFTAPIARRRPLC